MATDGRSALRPRLRFPEFRDSDGWEEKLAGDLFSNRAEHGEDGFPIYSVTIEDGMVKRSSLERKVDDISDSARNKMVRKNDIAYNMMRMWQGAFGVAVEDCMVSPAYVVLAPRDGVVSDFFARLLKLPQSLRLLTSRSHGLTKDRLRLYYKDFAQIPLSLPSPAEQQRIANCLTSLDELIVAQRRKVEALTVRKRGLVQQLFPREGESVPRLRFTRFRDGPEWTRIRLGSIADFFKGKGISKADLDPNGTRPCIRYGELYTRYSERIESVNSKTNAPASELFLSRKNDVIIPASGETKLDIAKAACVLINGVALGSDLNVIRTKHDGIFLSYQLNGPKRREIARVAQGDTVVHLYPSQLELLEVALPEEPEQTAIAVCLSSVDDEITLEALKVEILKAHKAGLMQQLFPAPNRS